MLRADFHPCVILLDLLMPVMDGMQFLDAKDADPALAALPVIVISGSLDNSAARARVTCFLSKPFNFAELLAAVSKYCGDHGPRP